jgi:hypothetical protein
MALPILGLVGAVLPVVSDVIKRLFPDPEQARQAENAIAVAILDKRHELEMAAASIVNTEAKSESFLTSNWRPIVMLGFFVLISARWFGLSAPNMSEAEYLAAWNLLEIGLGGYVIGRTVEKITPGLIAAYKGKP